jgi:hypothetical protein
MTLTLFVKDIGKSQVPVAHTCNPSYSGGRDQEDPGSKSVLGKKFSSLYLKKPHH